MTIGETLSEARGHTGLTVTQVSERTRIRETIIRDIERDDFASCGGDFYARGHIRAIAQVVGTDSSPLIDAYDHAHGWALGEGILDADMPTEADTPGTQETQETRKAHEIRGTQEARRARQIHELGAPAREFRPLPALRIPRRPPVNAATLIGLGLLAAIGLLGYLLTSGADGPTRTPAGAPTATGPARPARPQPTGPARTSVPPPPLTAAARSLIPASAVAFGPGGIGQGDNPQLAGQALAGTAASAWHTNWYTTAEFGGLQDGTGLLLNMGKSVTITSAQLTLGSAHGGSLELRAGNMPALASMQTVARAGDAGGSVLLRLPRPARARFLLIWFTRLPPDNAGTFEAWISDVDLKGMT
jgi:hypothetical protein